MKKVFASVIIVLSIIATSFVAVPFTAFGAWITTDPFITNNEVWIKLGVGGLMFVLALLYLIFACVEKSRTGRVSRSTADAAFIPMFVFTVFALVYSFILALFNYLYITPNPAVLMTVYPTNLIILGAVAVLLVNLVFIGHLMSINFREGKNLQRIFLFIALIELMAVSGYAGFYLYSNIPGYAGLVMDYYIGVPVIALIFYIVHLIILSKKTEEIDFGMDLEREVKDLAKEPEVATEEPLVPVVEKVKPVKLSKAEKAELQQEQIQSAKGKKTTIVSKEQAIISGEQNIDPTSLLYEEVSVDPEFNKTSNMDKQVSSIEYYIEKPKMFKPLDPTFDTLVAYVRELPNVITKISDERISFYVDRKPFLVLMNFGNYYRMAFRSDLEKGVRLIIKYPTISKNKGTKETLWFKANNYGDLPKEVIYDIVKSAFDNVNA